MFCLHWRGFREGGALERSSLGACRVLRMKQPFHGGQDGKGFPGQGKGLSKRSRCLRNRRGGWDGELGQAESPC